MTGNVKHISPGALIKAELKKRKTTQRQLAEATGLVPSRVCELIANKRNITTEVAEKLQDFFGIPAKEWLDLQTQFRLTHKDDAEETDASETICNFDTYISVKTLLSRCEVSKNATNLEKLDFFKNTFDIDSLGKLQNLGGYFKRSEKIGMDVRMLNTWMFLARRDARQCVVSGKFDRSTFDKITAELFIVFHENKGTLIKTANIMAKYGIRFCETTKVDRASVDGYSFVEKGVPSIVVTRRFDRIDNFAFAVMHELYHVYFHLVAEDDQRINIEGCSEETQKEEHEANEFAVNALIPKDVWENEAPQVRPIPHIIQREYSKWAKIKGFNKWIVLGRIAHDLGVYQMKGDKQRTIK